VMSAGWEPHRECVWGREAEREREREKEREMSDIALCNGGTNWSQTGHGTRPKTTSPTDGPQHEPWGRAERGRVIPIWIRG